MLPPICPLPTIERFPMTKPTAFRPLFVLLLLGLLLAGLPVRAQEGLPQPVAIPSNTTGEISLEAPNARYVIVGNSGESVQIQVLSLTPDFAPHFNVSNASGDVILEGTNPNAEPSISGELVISSTAAYLIDVSGEQGNGGQFVLVLQPGVPPPEPVDLLPGTPVTATVGGSTPLVIYRFAHTGLSEQRLTISGDVPGSGPTYRILDEASGEELASSNGLFTGGTHVLGATSGVYRIEVRAAGDGVVTPFTICLGCETTSSPAATETPSEAPTALPTPTATATATVEVCNVVSGVAGAINARSGPGTVYNMVGAVRAGDAFPVLAQSEDGGWYLFELRGNDAWVSSAVSRLEGGCASVPVIGPNGEVPNRTAVPADACTIVSTYSGNANVRIGPNEAFNLLGAFTPGQRELAQAQTSDGGWFMYHLRGNDAWVSSAVSRLEGNCAGLEQVAPVGNTAVPPTTSGNTQPNPPQNAAPTQANAQTSNPPADPPTQASESQTSGQPADAPTDAAPAQPQTSPANDSQDGSQPAAPPNTTPEVSAPGGQLVGQTSSTTAMPDLQVHFSVLTQTGDTTAPTYHWAMLVENAGNAPSGPFTLQMCVGNVCSEYAVPGLEPEHTMEQIMTFPAAGVQLHTATADLTNAVAESNESNNTFSANLGPDDVFVLSAGVYVDLQANGLLPDLAVTHVVIQDDTVDPPVISWQGGATNRGSAASGPWRLRLCVQESCATFDMPSLAPGESADRSMTYPALPETLNYLVVVDSTDLVVENDENNNSFSMDRHLDDIGTVSSLAPFAAAPPAPALPDLTVWTSLLRDTSTSEMVWTASVANVGQGASEQTTVLLCVLECVEEAVAPLEPGASANYEMRYPDGQGTIPHLAVVDSSNVVAESNEGNNSFEDSIDPTTALEILTEVLDQTVITDETP